MDYKRHLFYSEAKHQLCVFISTHHTDPTESREHIRVFSEAINRGADYLVFDTETTGLDPFNETYPVWSHFEGRVIAHKRQAFPFCLGLGILYNECLYIFIAYYDTELYKHIKGTLLLTDKTVVGHNIKYDVQVMYREQCNIHAELDDTLILARLALQGLPKYSLKFLGKLIEGYNEQEVLDNAWDKDLKAWLRRASSASTRSGKPKGYVNYSFIPYEILIPYLIEDIFNTFALYNMVKPLVFDKMYDAYVLEQKALQIAIKIERRGLHVDRQMLQQERANVIAIESAKLTSIKQQAVDYTFEDFNPSSPQQKIALLKLITNDETMLINSKGKISADKEVLERVNAEYGLRIISDILEYGRYKKIRTTYLERFINNSDAHGIIHCSYKVGDTKTGRFTSATPNFQNIPRVAHETEGKKTNNPVRKVITPRHGYEVYHFDLSQIELRAFAYFCQETKMLQAFAEGRDLHTATAELMYEDRYKDDPKLFRQYAKTINFGIIYGMGAAKLAAGLKVPLAEAKNLLAKYKHTFPGLTVLQNTLTKDIFKRGYITDPIGRQYHIPQEKAYKAVNYLTQGFCAQIMKKMLIVLDNTVAIYNKGMTVHSNMINTVHDEGVIEVPLSWTEEYRWYLLNEIHRKVTCILDIPAEILALKSSIDREVGSWAVKEAIDIGTKGRIIVTS